MSYKNVIAILGLSVLGFDSTLGWAQQPGSAPKDKSGAPGRGMMGGQMMAQMMAQHQEMSQLMAKMMQSMTAINTEKDPAKLKGLLA